MLIQYFDYGYPKAYIFLFYHDYRMILLYLISRYQILCSFLFLGCCTLWLKGYFGGCGLE
jgi:hypothetical protein